MPASSTLIGRLLDREQIIRGDNHGNHKQKLSNGTQLPCGGKIGCAPSTWAWITNRHGQ